MKHISIIWYDDKGLWPYLSLQPSRQRIYLLNIIICMRANVFKKDFLAIKQQRTHIKFKQYILMIGLLCSLNTEANFESNVRLYYIWRLLFSWKCCLYFEFVAWTLKYLSSLFCLTISNDDRQFIVQRTMCFIWSEFPAYIIRNHKYIFNVVIIVSLDLRPLWAFNAL